MRNVATSTKITSYRESQLIKRKAKIPATALPRYNDVWKRGPSLCCSSGAKAVLTTTALRLVVSWLKMPLRKIRGNSKVEKGSIKNSIDKVKAAAMMLFALIKF